ncbi:MAG: DNA-3-methyladenine glycosylase [Actinomycetia bacterium]|nr:DNA-3-methyladenine glycosylase [Actinomycetes bacterium]
MTLPREFFARGTVDVARELLGKVLVSRTQDTVTGGRIVEVEAYLGADDAGSHAATRGITRRNAVMYGPPGRAYVYFTYGNHHMLNLVTEAEGVAGAVLVRAIEPQIGIDAMIARRRGVQVARLCDGPGKLASALGITLADNGIELSSGRIDVLDAPAPHESVIHSGRVGLSVGHELQLRFYLAGNGYVSNGRIGPRPRHRVLTEG